MSSLGAVILAAGSGTRLGGVAKALLRRERRGAFLDQVVDRARGGHRDNRRRRRAAVRRRGRAHAGELGAGSFSSRIPSRRAGWRARSRSALARCSRPRANAHGCGRSIIPRFRSRRWIRCSPRSAHAMPRGRSWTRRGHPPLIARRLFERLAGCTELPNGARDVLAAADVIDVEVATRAACTTSTRRRISHEARAARRGRRGRRDRVRRLDTGAEQARRRYRIRRHRRPAAPAADRRARGRHSRELRSRRGARHRHRDDSRRRPGADRRRSRRTSCSATRSRRTRWCAGRSTSPSARRPRCARSTSTSISRAIAACPRRGSRTSCRGASRCAIARR